MSYQKKTLLCLAIILICAVIWGIVAADYPALTPEMAFRKAEKQELLGPSEILDTLSLELLWHDRVTIGRSDYGYSLYYWSEESEKLSDQLLYYPKEDSLTLVTAPESDLLPYLEGWEYAFFVFSEDPAAVQATLQLTLIHDGKTETYGLEAKKEYDCLFPFRLNESKIPRDSFLVYIKAGLDSNSYEAKVEIRVYDRNGQELDSLLKEYGGSK